jgi:rare lipoprotein A
MRCSLPLLVFALVLSSACSKRVAKAPVAIPVKKGYTETGIASWYGHPYHGRKTASGETYDMNKLTAAHRALPFGAVVEVENRKNKRRVDLKINDRGPFVDGRIIDVSRAAAQRLDMIGPGIVPVKIKVIRVP